MVVLVILPSKCALLVILWPLMKERKESEVILNPPCPCLHTSPYHSVNHTSIFAENILSQHLEKTFGETKLRKKLEKTFGGNIYLSPSIAWHLIWVNICKHLKTFVNLEMRNLFKSLWSQSKSKGPSVEVLGRDCFWLKVI